MWWWGWCSGGGWCGGRGGGDGVVMGVVGW